ncbi:MAG TPA: hypothetical protein DDZ53_09685, partial [Firmicutes bacterium]|nr:hypothetical protein [Bacillota bacterium]
ACSDTMIPPVAVFHYPDNNSRELARQAAKSCPGVILGSPVLHRCTGLLIAAAIALVVVESTVPDLAVNHGQLTLG